MALPKEDLVFKGTLIGHSDWVTQIAINPRVPDIILSSSRDKTLIIWKLKLNDDPDKDDFGNYGYPLKRLHGHGHFITDVVISNDNGKDGNFALSGSWDKTIRLWDLNVGKTTKRFVGHTNDVLSVAFSPDNRQIVSGSRDKSIKLWNTKAQCKYSIQEQDAHTDWVSCVRFSPSFSSSPIIVSAGWDRMVKVWNLANCKLKTNHIGHTGNLNTVTVSPDGSLCASGGRDYKVMLWDLTEGKHLYTLEHKDIINALCFYPKLSPNKYWLCVATGPTIKVWDLENKNLVDELKLVDTSIGKPVKPPQCTSLAWSVDGASLFAGFTDNQIRVWQLVPKEQFNS